MEIPAGIYLMGSRFSEGSPEERPMHEVAVASFFLDRTEVTVGAYAACLEAGACTAQRGPHPLCNRPGGKRDDHPINCVDHAQAEAYCRFAGKRLPSEREWEYAARGGSELRRFSWGEETPDGTRACYDHVGTCAVGSFAPGAFGLLDMSGNVWEWTSSWFGTYPAEPASGRLRIYRGGSFSRRFPKWLRTALRNRYEPGEWSAALGIRCARTPSAIRCPEDTEPRPAMGAELPPSCARTRGTPGCEPGYSWNGARCTVGGAGAGTGAGAGARAGARAEAEAARARTRAPGGEGTAAGAEAEAKPAPAGAPAQSAVTRARTPEHDGDCKRHYPGTPAAYRFSGGTFQSRNPFIEGGGCVRRDMGERWTSACCPE